MVHHLIPWIQEMPKQTGAYLQTKSPANIPSGTGVASHPGGFTRNRFVAIALDRYLGKPTVGTRHALIPHFAGGRECRVRGDRCCQRVQRLGGVGPTPDTQEFGGWPAGALARWPAGAHRPESPPIPQVLTPPAPQPVPLSRSKATTGPLSRADLELPQPDSNQSPGG